MKQTDDPDLDDPPVDSPAERDEIERLLDQLGVEWAEQEDPFVRLAFPEAGIPAPGRSRPAGEQAEGSGFAVGLGTRVHAVLGELAAARSRAEPLVAEFLALSAAERWQRANEDARLHEIPVIDALLARVEPQQLPAEEVEAIALLVLQMVPRASARGFPVRWLGDFLTQGWLLLSDVALARRDLPRAHFALDCARAHLQTGSGDSCLVFEVGRELAFVDWAAGRGAGAAAAFRLTLKLAASLADPIREGEICLWLDQLFTQLGDETRAFAARTRALALLGPEGFDQALRSHHATIDHLGLRLQQGHSRSPPGRKRPTSSVTTQKPS